MAAENACSSEQSSQPGGAREMEKLGEMESEMWGSYRTREGRRSTRLIARVMAGIAAVAFRLRERDLGKEKEDDDITLTRASVLTGGSCVSVGERKKKRLGRAGRLLGLTGWCWAGPTVLCWLGRLLAALSIFFE